MKKTHIASAALTAASALFFSANAATVAEGVNTVGSVSMQIAAHGETLAANFYVPKGCSEGNKCPAVVVSHPWGGVKEQTSGYYAQALSRKGFVTVAFDASHYGMSTGEPRDFESPESRVEDIRSAVSWLANRPEVDASRIGSLGICAGGGYALHEVQSDPRVKAVAAVSAYDIGAAARDGIDGGVGAQDGPLVRELDGAPMTLENRRALLENSAASFTNHAAGTPFERISLLPENAEDLAKADAFTQEAASYYLTSRGRHPNAKNRVVTASLALHQTYQPFSFLSTIAPRPVLLIAGEKAQTLRFSRSAFNAAAEPKELVVVPNAHHFDLYDKPEFTIPIIEKLTQFFTAALTANSGVQAK